MPDPISIKKKTVGLFPLTFFMTYTFKKAQRLLLLLRALVLNAF